MAFYLLALKSAFRNPLRMFLTTVGIAIAIVAFIFLRTIIRAWYAGVEASSSDRLITRNRISLVFPLPLTYLEKIRGVQGVSDVGILNWFGAIYKDEKNFFAQFATDPESLLRLYPEFVLTNEEKQAFIGDRTGCLVGYELQRKYGFKVGDTIVLSGTIYPGEWKFTVRGVYKGAQKLTDTTAMYFHWKYLNEQLPEEQQNRIGIVAVKVNDPNAGPAVGAAIDKLFVNSPYETKTESEKAFQLSFVSMASAILKAISVVSGVILFIMTLIIGNTLAMSTRERINEYAAMRAIGFRPSHILRLVLLEGVVVGVVGIGLGVLAAIPLLQSAADFFQSNLGAFLGAFDLDPMIVALAAGVSLFLTVSAALVPAVRASQENIVAGLRRVE